MKKRVREVIRYLGYGAHAIDEKTSDMIRDSFKELDCIADVRFVYRIFEINRSNNILFEIGGIEIKSKDLMKNLDGCEQVALFAITLGAQVDLQLKRYEVTNIAKAVIFQACAAALLEEHCDRIQGEIAASTKPRFSAGYGDFSLIHQQEILHVLDAAKKIGLSVTAAGMLVPTKSVTALIGIKKE